MVVSLASGTRASLRYARERVKGVTPAGIGTPVTTIAGVASGGGSGLSKFTRASGSFVTDGFTPGQSVVAAGFTNAVNNGTWVVSAVTATDLTVIDASDVIVDETGDVSQSVRIALKRLRATGRNVNLEKNVLESAEVDADGQETDVRHGFNRVVGSPGFQLSMQDFDDIIEFAFGGTWTAVAAVTPGNITPNSAGTFTRTTGSWINDGFRPGDIIRNTGFADAANNADFRVITVTALVLTVASTTVVTHAAEAGTITMPGKRIDVSPTMISFLVERAFLDVGRYQVFNGVVVDQLANNVQPEAMIGGTINLLGLSAAAMSSTPVSGIAALEPTGSSPFAAFNGEIFEGGISIAVATSVESTLQRNRSLNPVIGSRFSPDVFEGTAKVQGTLVAYFQDEVLFNKFVNETESSIYMKFQDPNDATKFISVVFPRVKYTGAPMDPPQQGPVPLQMPFKALKKTGLAAPGSTTVNSLYTIQRSNS